MLKSPCFSDSRHEKLRTLLYYHAGWFWDAVEIQTRGRKANWIGCLPRTSGARVRELLERMKE